MPERNAVKANSKIIAQPWHDKLNAVKTTFQSRYHLNPCASNGFDGILGTEAAIQSLGNDLGALLSGDDVARETFDATFAHTMNAINNPFDAFSAEGADAMAPNANYNQFARLNPWTILGYIARAKCLEMFHTVNHDQPTITYEYNLSYVVKGTDPTRYTLPQAARDGSMADMYTLPTLSIDTAMVAATGAGQVNADGHLETIANSDAAGTGPSNWIKLPAAGNLFTDAGSQYDPAKYAIERNVQIGWVWYSIKKTDNSYATGALQVYADRQLATGEISKRVFHYPVSIQYTDSDSKVKTATAMLLGELNLDNGDYNVATSSAIIKDIKFNARVTNLANELGSVRAGNTKIVETFDVNNRVYGTVPITPEMADDFNAGGEGVSFVAFMVDKITEGFANVRDMDMEGALDASFTQGAQYHRLYPKLGGGSATVNFPLTARGAGGGDPFSWQTIGLKNTLNFNFTSLETDTYFEDNVPRQWYILGHEIDTQRIPDIQYTNFAGEAVDGGGAGAGAAGGAFKYGFAIDSAAGYADNFGRRVKVIGSKYRRHLYAPKTGTRMPMRAVLKSSSIEQPTTVYFPYSFRVFSGISPEYRNRPALCVAARDYIGVLTDVQARINLLGNDSDLYKNMAGYSVGANNPGATAAAPLYTGAGTGAPGSSNATPQFTKAAT